MIYGETYRWKSRRSKRDKGRQGVETAPQECDGKYLDDQVGTARLPAPIGLNWRPDPRHNE